MLNIISLSRGITTMQIYLRELHRMETECGNSCPDWYADIYDDAIDNNRDDDGSLDWDSFETDMVNLADEYIRFELEEAH